MLLIQQYLQTHSFADLIKDHGVYATFDKNYRKFSLNYDMLEAKSNDTLASQCRGLILKFSNNRSLSSLPLKNNKPDFLDIIAGDTEIIALPFFRFFNSNDSNCAELNWNDSNLLVQNKLDGSCIILSFDEFKNAWYIATRSVSEADIPLFDDFTFRSLFEKAIQESLNISFNDFTKDLDKDYTYIFELVSSYNQIVVKYENSDIYLLGIRDKISTHEICPYICSHILPNVKRPEIYSIKNINDAINFVNSRNPKDFEGLVVRDSKFNRVKIKNPEYILLSKCKDSLLASDRNILSLILNEKQDDVIGLLPQEIQDKIINMQIKLVNYFNKFQQEYELIIKQTNAIISNFPELQPQIRKVFATLINSLVIWKAPCFDIFMGKNHNIKEYIKSKAKNGEYSNNILDIILDQLDIVCI